MLRLLGPIRVSVDDAIVPLGGPKQRLALSLLATNANRVVTTDHLVASLWPNDVPGDPRAALRVHLSNLRSALSAMGATIEHRDRGYALDVDPHRIDLYRFTTLVERGTPLVGPEPVRAATILRDALGLWRGRPFGDLEAEPALAADVTRCEELRLRAIEGRIDADLALGDHARLISELRELVNDHPLRERLHGQLMLALYRADRQGEALQIYDRARQGLATDLGADPSPALQDLHTRILRQDPALTLPSAVAAEGRGAALTVTADARNPYKGLRAFTEADVDDFFGREDLTGRLLDRLIENGLLAIVGPSGSGKSSVVRAGVLPALRRGDRPGTEHWTIATMVPGEWPMAELERALAEVPGADSSAVSDRLGAGPDGLVGAATAALTGDSELVLVVDQFEEVFSVARAADRDAFLDHLCSAVEHAESSIRIVATVRSDFYDQLLVHPRLGALVAERTIPVPALSPEELHHAVAAPARRAGVMLEPELEATIIDDVADEPGALPLVQYALTELFDRRNGHTLTLPAYRAIGGLRGALAGRAEELYSGLDEPSQQACRQVFLRLVTIGDNNEETKRRVLRSELMGAAAPDTVDRVLETFGAHRLLTFDRDPFTHASTVEVAHEALTHRWGRLRGWIDGARNDVVMHRRLLAAAAEWRVADQDPGYLMRDPKLRDFEEWAATSSLRLTEQERSYVAASSEAQAARAATDRARRDRERILERRSVLRLRALVAVLAIGIVAASALSIFAIRQRDEARRQSDVAVAQREAAQRQERIARARELAAASRDQLEEDPERSILLAREAVTVTRQADGVVLPEAESALHEAVRHSRVEEVLPVGGGLAIGSDGTLAVTGVDGRLSVRSPDGEVLMERTDRTTSPLTLPGENAPRVFLERTDDVDLSPDGTRLVSVASDFTAQIIDVATGELVVELDRRAIRPMFSPDGSMIAAVLVQEGTAALWDTGRTLGLWDADTGALVRLFEGHAKSIDDHAFSPDGRRLATAAPQGDSLRLWDAATGQSLVAVDRTRAKAVGFSPDGTLLAVGGADGRAELRDAETLEIRQPLRGHEGDIFAVAFAPDGSRVVVAGRDAEVLDPDTGAEVMALTGHQFVIADVAFSADGDRIVTSSEDGTTRTWDVAFPGGREVAVLPAPPAPARGAVALAPDGDVLAASAPDGIRLWDMQTWSVIQTLPTGRGGVGELAFSPDGTRLAASLFTPPPGPGVTGRLAVWDVASGTGVLDVGDHGGVIWDIAFGPDGQRIATATDNEGIARVLDADSGAILATYRLEEGSASSVEFTADGTRLFVGGQDAGYLVDPATGAVVLPFAEADEAILDDRLLADDHLLTGDIAGRVQIWDLADGTVSQTLLSAPQGVWAVGASAQFVAAATPPGLAIIERGSGERRLDLETGHAGPVVDLGFSPDGRYLATAGADGTVRVFVTQVEDLLLLADERLTRSFTQDECRRFLHAECPDAGGGG